MGMTARFFVLMILVILVYFIAREDLQDYLTSYIVYFFILQAVEVTMTYKKVTR